MLFLPKYELKTWDILQKVFNQHYFLKFYFYQNENYLLNKKMYEEQIVTRVIDYTKITVISKIISLFYFIYYDTLHFNLWNIENISNKTIMLLK